MGRFRQTKGMKGSLRWIQQAVEQGWSELEQPIFSRLARAQTIEWKSPLAHDDFAEYRDGAFLDRLGLSEHAPALAEFWPAGGPQWDALGVTDQGHVLLVEAKAHIAEMCSSGTAAGPESRAKIAERLNACAEALGASKQCAPWTDHFYQLANRYAHLHFLRGRGVNAYLVFVNFLNDREMGGPTVEEAWKAAYEVAHRVMGLGTRHRLSPFIVEVFPDVSARAS
jgi:hypothetical protein